MQFGWTKTNGTIVTNIQLVALFKDRRDRVDEIKTKTSYAEKRLILRIVAVERKLIYVRESNFIIRKIARWEWINTSANVIVSRSKKIQNLFSLSYFDRKRI